MGAGNGATVPSEVATVVHVLRVACSLLAPVLGVTRATEFPPYHVQGGDDIIEGGITLLS